MFDKVRKKGILLFIIGIVIGTIGTISVQHLLYQQSGTQQQQQQQQQQHEKNYRSKTFKSKKYTQTQTLGFQIYAGGAPAFINISTQPLTDLNYDNENNDDYYYYSNTKTYSKQNLDDKQKQKQQHYTVVKNPECFDSERYGLLGTGPEAELLCYVGSQNSTIDVQERIRIMTDAITIAYKHSNTNNNVLKIFIAPEFFFRGINGAYKFNIDEQPENFTICGPVCQIITSLQQLVANVKYKDWLFIFGTIVAYDTITIHVPTNTTTTSRNNNKRRKLTSKSKSSYTTTDDDDYTDNNNNDDNDKLYMFYNFAPIYRGYDPNESNVNAIGKRFILPKRYTSNLDFLTPQRLVQSEDTIIELIEGIVLPKSNETLINPILADITRYNNTVWDTYKDVFLKQLGYTMIEYDWLIIDDITITIEICLDHYRKVALQSYMANIITGSTTLIPKSSYYGGQKYGLDYVPIPTSQAQVSIVSSAGMTINPESIVLVQNGTIYLQDGLYDDPAQIIWASSTSTSTGTNANTDSMHVIEETLGGSEAITRTAVLSPTEATFEYTLIPAITKVPLYPNDDNNNNDVVDYKHDNNVTVVNRTNSTENNKTMDDSTTGKRITKLKNMTNIDDSNKPNTTTTSSSNYTKKDGTNKYHRRVTATRDKKMHSVQAIKKSNKINNNNKHHSPLTKIAKWKIALNGTFSIERHEPMIVIWGTRDIPVP